MQAFTHHGGFVAPLDRSNVDTDAIIPKQFLTSIRRTGFGPNLFDEWRYLDRGVPGQDNSQRPRNPAFVLNLPCYRQSSILLARDNFGCGSSREHAAWALMQHGFRVVIAASFGDIFYQNSLKNGLLCIALAPDAIAQLFAHIGQAQVLQLMVDLPSQTVASADGALRFDFAIDASRKHCLLQGLDEVAQTLQQAEAIRAFERQHRAAFPWLAEASASAR